MKKILLFSLILFFCFRAKSAVITWDGGGGDGLWETATNWMGDVIPGPADDVVLDNSSVAGNYMVTLPAGAINVTINTLAISPNSGNTIRLILPAVNTAAPALTINQTVGNALLINSGGILENNSGAAFPGTPINVGGTGTTRINNGGRYIHNSGTNAIVLISSLSAAAGTEVGVFEYAQASTIFPSNTLTYGSIELTTTNTKIMSTTGSQAITIRGFFKINTGVTFTSTKDGDFRIAGDLIIDGSFDLSPPSGPGNKRLMFNGTSNQTISGAGNFTFGTMFASIEVNSGTTVTLQRGITLSNTAHNFNVNTGGTLQMGENVIGGTGRFQLLAGGWLGIGSPGGIASTGPSGNVQTTNRSFAGSASYEYNSGPGVTQVTGLGLPSTVSGKLIINSKAGLGTTGVTLSTTMMVSGEFILNEGKFTTGVSGNIIYIGSFATTTAAYTDISFVNGPMYKLGNTDYVFPVGKGVGIHPMGMITTMGASTDLCLAEYFNSGPSCSPNNPNAPIDHISGLEYWSLSRTSSSNPSSQITLYATTYSQATDMTRLVVAACLDGIGWLDFGNANPAVTGFSGPLTSVSKMVNGFPTILFTLASLDPSPVNPLPINLISFDAIKLTATRSSVNWKLAACCSPAAKFEIQRADANKNFVTIGSTGGSATNTSYDYTDNGLKNGINYYRLKMIDDDGKIIYSRTVAVMNGVNGLLLTSLIPTVITNAATLTIASSHQQKLDLIITDVQGKVVKRQNYTVTAGNTNIELSTERLAAGVYQLIGLTPGGKTNVIRFIKQ